MALFRILTDALLSYNHSRFDNSLLLQHSVSLRSNILSLQQQCVFDDGFAYHAGWLSSITDTNSLMNTESISLGVLALGASANRVYEVGVAPLTARSGFFYRPYFVLSAVADQSYAGNMLINTTLDLDLEGSIAITAVTRSPYTGSDPIAQFTVHDDSNVLLGSSVIYGSFDLWTNHNAIAHIPKGIVIVNIDWFGVYSLDVGFITFSLI